jgi:ribosome biogenesis SPOUT family RNA methylase Rps3
MVKIIIEHLDKRLWKWCFTEYKHISEFANKSNVIFTNIKGEKAREKLSPFGKVYKESVSSLSLKNACVLDPCAKETLLPSDKFDYLILGVILGDFPPKKRTKKELTSKLGYPARNLGHNQMSTNTAAYVAWKIMHGTPLQKIKFRRKMVVKISDCEEIIMPYKFVEENGKIFMPDGYIELVKKYW